MEVYLSSHVLAHYCLGPSGATIYVNIVVVPRLRDVPYTMMFNMDDTTYPVHLDGEGTAIK